METVKFIKPQPSVTDMLSDVEKDEQPNYNKSTKNSRH